MHCEKNLCCCRRPAAVHQIGCGVPGAVLGGTNSPLDGVLAAVKLHITVAKTKKADIDVLEKLELFTTWDDAYQSVGNGYSAEKLVRKIWEFFA